MKMLKALIIGVLPSLSGCKLFELFCGRSTPQPPAAHPNHNEDAQSQAHIREELQKLAEVYKTGRLKDYEKILKDIQVKYKKDLDDDSGRDPITKALGFNHALKGWLDELLIKKSLDLSDEALQAIKNVLNRVKSFLITLLNMAMNWSKKDKQRKNQGIK